MNTASVDPVPVILVLLLSPILIFAWTIKKLAKEIDFLFVKLYLRRTVKDKTFLTEPEA